MTASIKTIYSTDSETQISGLAWLVPCRKPCFNLSLIASPVALAAPSFQHLAKSALDHSSLRGKELKEVYLPLD